MPETPDGQLLDARHLMGCRVEVVIRRPDATPAWRQSAAEAALDEIERLERQLSIYLPESEISGLNATSGETPVRVEPRLFELLTRCCQLSQATEGAFDITLGALIRCWGFATGQGELPSPEAWFAARQVSGWELLQLDPQAWTAFLPVGMELNLGAIGKGYAVDCAAEELALVGATDWLLHAGTSSVLASGSSGDGQPGWLVAVAHPGEPSPLATVRLKDTALAVSAPHGRAFRVGEAVLGHVLDPRTGRPAQSAKLAAVTHSSAAVADALSTALLVLGSQGFPPVARRFPEAQWLVLEDREGGVVGTSCGDAWLLRDRSTFVDVPWVGC